MLVGCNQRRRKGWVLGFGAGGGKREIRGKGTFSFCVKKNERRPSPPGRRRKKKTRAGKRGKLTSRAKPLEGHIGSTVTDMLACAMQLANPSQPGGFGTLFRGEEGPSYRASGASGASLDGCASLDGLVRERGHGGCQEGQKHGEGKLHGWIFWGWVLW